MQVGDRVYHDATPDEIGRVVEIDPDDEMWSGYGGSVSVQWSENVGTHPAISIHLAWR